MFKVLLEVSVHLLVPFLRGCVRCIKLFCRCARRVAFDDVRFGNIWGIGVEDLGFAFQRDHGLVLFNDFFHAQLPILVLVYRIKFLGDASLLKDIVVWVVNTLNELFLVLLPLIYLFNQLR